MFLPIRYEYEQAEKEEEKKKVERLRQGERTRIKIFDCYITISKNIIDGFKKASTNSNRFGYPNSKIHQLVEEALIEYLLRIEDILHDEQVNQYQWKDTVYTAINEFQKKYTDNDLANKDLITEIFDCVKKIDNIKTNWREIGSCIWKALVDESYYELHWVSEKVKKIEIITHVRNKYYRTLKSISNETINNYIVKLNNNLKNNRKNKRIRIRNSKN